MSKILIAVMSCRKDMKTHKAITDTWGLKFQSTRIFIGMGCATWDEIVLPVLDDYKHVTEKSRAIFCWALGNGYDFVLHVGRDTYVNIPEFQLRLEHLQKYDYAGRSTQRRIGQPQPSPPYTLGGSGTWLSKRSMWEIVQSPKYHVWDDFLYGQILAEAGIKLHDCDSFGTTMTRHLSKSTGVYNPSDMYDTHRKFGY